MNYVKHLITPSERIKIWNESLEKIAVLDWAVEGFPAPYGETLSRSEAVDKRNNLVRELKKVME